MKLKVITYKDGSMGYETPSIAVSTVGGVVDSVKTIRVEEKRVEEFLDKPDKFELKGEKLVERKAKKGK